MTPTRLSIHDSLGRGQKRYLSLLNDFWAETGVGGPGEYDGHYHLGFTDVMYSPSGITYRDELGAVADGKLLVIPPRVWFKPLRLGEFWFIKFFQSSIDASVAVPDKTDQQQGTSSVSAPRACISSGSIELPFWDRTASRYGIICFKIENCALSVKVSDSPWLLVTV
jgi:hypothetical protein